MDERKPHRLTREGIRLHAPADFDGMRQAGRVVAGILDEVAALVRPGAATAQIDDWITARVSDLGAKSATIGYRGYKHASCISVNHVVCHGIPGSPIPKCKHEKAARGNDVLLDGDILNIDVTVIVDGWYGDSSRMYIAGQPKPFALRLIQDTYDALLLGIRAVKPGHTFGDIGAAIQTFAERRGLSVVRDFCGHGIGRVFHAPPNVLHYGRPGTEAVLQEGMFFTIEPMINLGRSEIDTLSDDWTAVTRDKSLSAQFEHSVGVTAQGCEIFTLSPVGKFHPTW